MMMSVAKNKLVLVRILLFVSEMLAIHLGEIFSFVVYITLLAIKWLSN